MTMEDDAVPASRWRRMSTAPRSDTLCIGWFPRLGQARTMAWSVEAEAWCIAGAGEALFPNSPDCGEPVAWMPAPYGPRQSEFSAWADSHETATC